MNLRKAVPLVSALVWKLRMHIYHHGLFAVYVLSWAQRGEALRQGMVNLSFSSFHLISLFNTVAHLVVQGPIAVWGAALLGMKL